jgi:hypothetical protein
MVICENRLNIIKSLAWGLTMGVMVATLAPVGSEPGQRIFIFAVIVAEFSAIGWLFLAYAKKTNHYRTAHCGMAALVILPIIGHYMGEWFGLWGYIVTILATMVLAKIYMYCWD